MHLTGKLCTLLFTGVKPKIIKNDTERIPVDKPADKMD